MIFLFMKNSIERIGSTKYHQTPAELEVYKKSKYVFPCMHCKANCTFPALAIFQYAVEVCCAACSPKHERPVEWLDCLMTALWNYEQSAKKATVQLARDLFPYMEEHWGQLFHEERTMTGTWRQSANAQFSTHHNVFESIPGPVQSMNRWRLRRPGTALPEPFLAPIVAKRSLPLEKPVAAVKMAKLEPETFDSILSKVKEALKGKSLLDWRECTFCIDIMRGARNENLIGSCNVVDGEHLEEWQYIVLAALGHYVDVPLNNLKSGYRVLAKMVLDWFEPAVNYLDRAFESDCFCPKDAFGKLLPVARSVRHTDKCTNIRAFF